MNKPRQADRGAAPLAVVLRQTQWLLDEVAFDLPAGRVTPEKREELAHLLEDLADLVRATPTVIDGEPPPDSPAGRAERGIKERP